VGQKKKGLFGNGIKAEDLKGKQSSWGPVKKTFWPPLSKNLLGIELENHIPTKVMSIAFTRTDATDGYGFFIVKQGAIGKKYEKVKAIFEMFWPQWDDEYDLTFANPRRTLKEALDGVAWFKIWGGKFAEEANHFAWLGPCEKGAGPGGAFVFEMKDSSYLHFDNEPKFMQTPEWKDDFHCEE